MDIHSTAYHKATHLLTSATVAEMDHQDKIKCQCRNYTFSDSGSLIDGELTKFYTRRNILSIS